MAKKRRRAKRKSRSIRAALPRAYAAVLAAIVEHLRITPLDGVTAILKLHSTVEPFPDPVRPTMSLVSDFELAPLGRENMAPDLTALRRALGNSGVVKPSDARKAETVANLVTLVS